MTPPPAGAACARGHFDQFGATVLQPQLRRLHDLIDEVALTRAAPDAASDCQVRREEALVGDIGTHADGAIDAWHCRDGQTHERRLFGQVQDPVQLLLGLAVEEAWRRILAPVPAVPAANLHNTQLRVVESRPFREVAPAQLFAFQATR